MIIKSHVRGGFRWATTYMKEKGENETTRLVEMSDPAASNLDEAFYLMWAITSLRKVTTPLHHISINPYMDERLTDAYARRIIERCEQKYGYKPGDHQRVVVEHVKKERQHFHVIWNRVSLVTGKSVWPGHHWRKSKQAAREMERELGLRRTIARRILREQALIERSGRRSRILGRYQALEMKRTLLRHHRLSHYASPSKPTSQMMLEMRRHKQRKQDEGGSDSEIMALRLHE